jgi:hypothetical protein
MINFIICYIEKIEKYFEKYIFIIYVYTQFSCYIFNNWFLNFREKLCIWDSIKFVNQIWSLYNAKFYYLKQTSFIKRILYFI